MNSPHTLFVGIGSPHGDDRAGWMVAEALREQNLAGVDVRQAATPSQLLDWIGPFDRLVVADAYLADSESPDRTGLQRWNWPTYSVAVLRSANSHAFGLPQVLQLAERLGALPRNVVLFGIAGANFSVFSDLSEKTRTDLQNTVNLIADELEELRHA